MGDKEQITPFFSVVIPLFNKEDTIARTIHSVFAQTYRDWELIVVNDGSTDDSLLIVNQLAKDIPFRIIDKSNEGVSVTRNIGARLANGKYIALLDADDIWYPNHLKLLYEAIKRYSDIKFFGTGYEKISGKYIYFTIPWGGVSIKDVYSTFRYGQPINSSTVAIERELWNNIGGFDEHFSFYEDYEFFFRLGQLTKCCVIRQISAVYMSDAIQQTTRSYHKCSKVTRPHLAFIECMVQGKDIEPSMLAFADAQIGVMVHKAYLKKDGAEIALLAQEFPYLMHKFLPYLTSRWRLVKLIAAVWGLLIYKIRCHLIIWRRHA